VNANVQQQNPVDDIIAGQWASTVRNIFAATGDVFPSDITSRLIDGMFGWGLNVPPASQCCRSYAQAIVNLLALPTGRNLIKKIITKCHENSMQGKNPKKVVFINDGSGNNLTWEYIPNNDSSKCDINLQWNGNTHVWEDWVLLVKERNKNEPAFINVRVSPAIVLAHELGHFLWALTVRHDDTTSSPKLLNARVQQMAEEEYNKIFNNIVFNGKKKVNKLFIDSWNYGNFVETVNILPLADISSATNVVGLRYSDGIFIGEALSSTWNADQKPQFTNFKGNGANVTHDNLLPGNFVRFSHMVSKNFSKRFNKLKSEEKKAFKSLVNQLLSKIQPAGEAALEIADLPSIN
jgi:hypothetical protein